MTIEQIKTDKESLKKQFLAASKVTSQLFRQLHTLQEKCPHPFAEIEWYEWIPMGCAKGRCRACGYGHIFSTRYSKEEMDTVEFVIK